MFQQIGILAVKQQNMKIAIATNDRKTIAKRTGRAAEFAIYNIENGAIQSIDYQKNTHTHHDDHDRNEGNHRQGHSGGNGHGHHHNHNHDHEHGEHNHDEIINQLKEIDMFLVRAVGKYMKKDLVRGNIPYQLVKKENIEEILDDYIKNLA